MPSLKTLSPMPLHAGKAASNGLLAALLAKRGFTQVGEIEVERTYRCVLTAGHFADSVTGGINEHGVSMGIEWMGMKKALVSKLGKVSTCSSHSSSSLIANGPSMPVATPAAPSPGRSSQA